MHAYYEGTKIVVHRAKRVRPRWFLNLVVAVKLFLATVEMNKVRVDCVRIPLHAH